MIEEPKNRYELQALNIDELVSMAKLKLSRKFPFKENLVKYLVEVLDLSEEKALFEAMCGTYGLKPTDWDRPFQVRRSTLRINGFNPGKPKNKFNIINQDGKQFHCGVSFLRRNLALPVKVRKGKQVNLKEFLNDKDFD